MQAIYHYKNYVHFLISEIFSDYPPSPWMNSNHNGDMRGNNRSPFEMNQNYSPYNDGPARGSSNVHCVHMRGLPFKATQNDIADVRTY